ncbi:MspA family porin [Nocardia sp. NPDC058633]|uniref:MspA family porin n=1 Tax=Nocardia sp. NPDC058633 TaxID=3346568 RepID=UPI003657EB53
MINRKKAACAANLAAVTTVAIGLFSNSAANADVFIPLADSVTSQTLPDGSVVTVTLTNQSANINPSMGSTPLHRNTWVTATARVEVANGRALLGILTPGYVVGCQVQINGGGVNGGASVTGASDSVAPSGTGGASLSLGPGQQQSFSILDREERSPFDTRINNPANVFAGGDHASVSWKDTTIALNGCGGYAQARAFATASVDTGRSKEVITVWGDVFSLG